MLPTKISSNSVDSYEKEEPYNIPSQHGKKPKENTLPSFEFTGKTNSTIRAKQPFENLKFNSTLKSEHLHTMSSPTVLSSQNASQTLGPNFSTAMETLNQEFSSENRNQQRLPSLKDLYGILNTDGAAPMHTVSFPDYHSTAHFSQDSKNITAKQQSQHFAIHGGRFVQASIDGTGFKIPHSNSFNSADSQDGCTHQNMNGKRRLNSSKSSSSNSSTSHEGSSDNELSDEVMPQAQDDLHSDSKQTTELKNMDGDGATHPATHHAKAKKRKKKTKIKKYKQTEQLNQSQEQDGTTSTSSSVVLPSLENMVSQHVYHSSSSSLDNSTGFSFRKQNQPSSAFLSPRNRTNNNIVNSPHEVQQNYFDQHTNTSHQHSNTTNQSATTHEHHQHSNFSVAALSQHNNYFAAHPNANFAPESLEKPSKPNAFKPRVIFGGNIVDSNNSNSNSSNSATTDTRSSSSSGSKNEVNVVINEGPWSEEEHARFLAGLNDMGRNWTKIAKDYVKSRVRTQVASHAQKYFKKVNKGVTTPGDKEQDGQQDGYRDGQHDGFRDGQQDGHRDSHQ